jgi:hypothetical protein
MNEQLNKAVERLLCDRRFLGRFRRSPESALARYDLNPEEIEAVKRGNPRELLALGLDPQYVLPSPPLRGSGVRLLLRAKRLTPALVFAAMVLPAAPAFAAETARSRSRGRSRVGRVSRYFGRQRVAGRFYGGLARTGGAGRVTSGAASGADSSAYTARVRSSARDFGIQPPPPPDTT